MYVKHSVLSYFTVNAIQIFAISLLFYKNPEDISSMSPLNIEEFVIFLIHNIDANLFNY